MHNRSLLCAALCICGLALAVLPVTAASPSKHKPAPASKYAGLQYDEIVRMVLAPATPPPPGSFADAYAQVMADAQAQPSAEPAKHHGGLAGLMSNISNMGQQVQQAANQVQTLMKNGHLTRLAYYNGWVRTDDPVNKTATIDKCREHQLIQLDLAHKTYKTVDTQGKPQACPTPAMPAANQRQEINEAPGTVDLSIASTAKGLGGLNIQGVPTTGSVDTTKMSMTNATGSCKNGSFEVQSTRYVSNLRVPRRYCPMPKTTVAASTPVEAVVHGGCKPAIKGGATGAYWMRTGDRLELYDSMAMMSGENSGRFQTVTQRGNVNWLTKSQADALFSVPSDFTQAQ